MIHPGIQWRDDVGPGVPPPIIDVHAHYLALDTIATLLQRPGGQTSLERAGDRVSVRVGKDRYGPLPRELSNADDQVTSLSSRGVVHALVSLPPFLFLYHEEVLLAEEFARAHNDALAGLVHQSDGALSGLATVPLQDPERAADVLSQAMDELHLVGVEIGTHVNGMNLDDPTLAPFWERAEQTGALIMIHPADVRGIAFNDDYYLRNLIGNPLETTYALARLVLGGVFERYPDLRVLASHAGGFFPFALGRLDRGYARRHECRGAIPHPPSVYLQQLYFDTITHSQESLEYLVAFAGAAHVAIGTDFPFDMGDEEVTSRVAALPVAVKAQVAHRTAINLISNGGHRSVSAGNGRDQPA